MTPVLYDVVIIGSGPAGMFAALELTKLRPDLRIAIFEKGFDRKGKSEDNLLSGWGGAGAFSDGKLTLPDPKYPRSMNIGGQLAQIIGQSAFLELIDYVNQTYTEFGGSEIIYEHDDEEIEKLVYKASIFDIKVTPTRVRHFGSDMSPQIVNSIKDELERRGVEIFLQAPVDIIQIHDSDKFSIEVSRKIRTDLPKNVMTKYIIVAPGRGGADWLASIAESNGIEILPRQMSVDIGVRVEALNHTLQPLTDYLYDPKIEYYPKPFKDKVRTFCVCKSGGVVLEKYQGDLTTVNGHSLYEKPISENTNFAILVSIIFTEPFREPIRFARGISELTNMLGGGALIQRLGDLRDGRRSTIERIKQGFVEPTLKEATPGDISFAIPHRPLMDILGMLEALDKIAPGINGENTLIYASEVKFYSSRIKTIKSFETAIPGLFVAGDGSGYTRGLIQSSMMGVITARAIAVRALKSKLRRGG